MWLVISVLLVLWVVYDIITGEVWSYYKISRKEEPGKYWLFIFTWSVIAATSLYASYFSYY